MTTLRSQRMAAKQIAGSGFTMIELLVSMMLLSISMSGLMALQIGVIRQTGQSRRASEAAKLAQTRIEPYTRMPFARLPAPQNWQTARDASDNLLHNVGVCGQGAGPFTVDEQIDAVAGNQRVITVRVSWAEGVGGAATRREITLSTRRFP